MKKLFKVITSIGKGVLTGAVDSTPLALFKGIGTDIKDIIRLRIPDLNNDGNRDFEDVKLLLSEINKIGWGLLGKILVIVAAVIALYVYVL